MKLRPYFNLMRLSLRNPMLGLNIGFSKDGFILIVELLLVQVTAALVVDETAEGEDQ